jgi:type IV pilus assembly protein PilC
MKEGPMRMAVASLGEEVETGTSLSEAMAKHPGVFDDLYVNMIRAGEASGALTTICNRLATFMEKSDALLRKIRGALIYPIIVLLVAVSILTFIMLFVVPKFEQTFSELGGKLPGMTQFLIDTARWLVDHWYVLVLFPLALWGGFVLIGRTRGGRRAIDRFKLRMWLFGSLSKKAHIARITRTLGTLSSSGVPLMQSLEIVGETSGNVIVKESMDQVRTAVREGESMARPMAETGLFDDIVVNMVDVGEETGELDRMLIRIADNNDAEVDMQVSVLVKVLEPVLIVVMAVIVGFIVIALFLPLLALQEQIGR